MSWKLLVVLLLIILIIVGLANLSGKHMINSPQNWAERLQVTTSFYPLYFFAEEIGGNKINVTNLTPAGVEPHEYEPTAQDIAIIEQSRIVILNGGGFEPWGDSVRQNIDKTKTILVSIGEDLATHQIEEGGKIEIDPHVWLSPLLAGKIVERITEVLIQVDPENTSYYHTNSNNLLHRINDLDMKYKGGLVSCRQKNIITAHASFGYLAEAYGFRQKSVTGISPDEEPSPQELSKIAKFANDNHIRYVFFEELVSPKLSKTLAQEIGAETLVLNPLESLSIEEQARGENYFTVMEDNLTNLQIALECTTAPIKI